MISFCVLDCFEVRGASCPGSHQQRGVVAVPFGHPDGRVVTLSQWRECCGPPQLWPVGDAFERGVQGQRSRYFVEICVEPDTHGVGGGETGGRGNFQQCEVIVYLGLVGQGPVWLGRW